MVKRVMLGLALCGLSLTALAETQSGTEYEELQLQADQQGTIGVIVTLQVESAEDMIIALRAGETPPQPGDNSEELYMAAQEEFMHQFGYEGVESVHFFTESPSMALKLEAAALERLLAMGGIASIVSVPDTLILFDD